MTGYFSQLLSCSGDELLFSHAFLMMPESPTPLVERDILTCLGTTLLMTPERVLCLPLGQTGINLEAWATQWKTGAALGPAPVQIHLKGPLSLPHQKEYPQKPETKQWLPAVVGNLKGQGLLRHCTVHVINPLEDQWGMEASTGPQISK